MNLSKLRRVLSKSITPELVIAPGADEDEQSPLSAIQFAPPTPLPIERRGVQLPDKAPTRPRWHNIAKGLQVSAATLRVVSSGDDEKKRAISPPLAPPPVTDTNRQVGRAGRMIRKWVRERRGRRWVEDDYQEIVMELRMLRA